MKIDKKLIKELTDYLNEFGLTELEYGNNETKIKVSKSNSTNTFHVSENKNLNVKLYFIHQIRKKFKLNKLNLLAMQINLFLSMLPLHKDDKNRQNALFANAFRLYFDHKKDLKCL